ncbi:MAG: hypothetical protein HYY93_06550 [Planctomycetes bacterium]|nr:hypothetical protein [Planctomycetota bacterium]
MRQPILALVLLAAILPLRAQEAPAADWTILMYAIADTDLEDYMVQDLAEMALARPSDRVRVLIQFDRAEEDDEDEGYSSEPVGEIGDFDSVKRLTLRDGKIVEVSDLGELNMGDPKTLSDFLAWGLKTAPAKRCALILQDHGLGWAGFGGDGSHEDDDLPLDELSGAIASGLKQGGVDRLDLLCFDCCLMGDLDVMTSMQKFARYLIASQDLEPGEGWDNDAWLSALAEHPEMPPEAIGRVICDTFLKSYEESDDEEMRLSGTDVTLALVDLSKVPRVTAAAQALGQSLAAALKKKDPRADWERIARAGLETEQYDAGDEPSYVFDLHDLASRLKGVGCDAEAAEAVRAVEAAVIHHVGGRNRPKGSGISVYLPREVDAFDELYRDSAFSASWVSMIEAYLAIQAADEEPPEVSDPIAADDTLAKGESTPVKAEARGSDIAETYFVLAQPSGDEQVILGMLPATLNGSRLESNFRRSWLAIGDAGHQVLAPIVYYEKIPGEADRYSVDVDAEYCGPKGKRWQDIILTFEVTWSEKEISGKFVSAYRTSEDGTTPMELREGGRIRPVYTVVTAEGEEEDRTLENAPTLVVDAEGIRMLETDLPAGTYDVGFLAVDLAGNIGEAYVGIEVE